MYPIPQYSVFEDFKTYLAATMASVFKDEALNRAKFVKVARNHSVSNTIMIEFELNHKTLILIIKVIEKNVFVSIPRREVEICVGGTEQRRFLRIFASTFLMYNSEERRFVHKRKITARRVLNDIQKILREEIPERSDLVVESIEPTDADIGRSYYVYYLRSDGVSEYCRISILPSCLRLRVFINFEKTNLEKDVIESFTVTDQFRLNALVSINVAVLVQ